MAYWFGRCSLFAFCFFNSSAEMCAGSLGLGCRILGMFATRSQVYGLFFSDYFWSKVGCLGLQKQKCGNGCLARMSTLAENGLLMIPGSIFHDFV